MFLQCNLVQQFHIPYDVSLLIVIKLVMNLVQFIIRIHITISVLQFPPGPFPRKHISLGKNNSNGIQYRFRSDSSLILVYGSILKESVILYEVFVRMSSDERNLQTVHISRQI
jgi:hypothetical protein